MKSACNPLKTRNRVDTGKPGNPVFFMQSSELLARDDQPKNQVHQYAGNAAGDQGEQESKSEPDRVDIKELSQTTAYSHDDAIAPRTP